MITSLDQKVQTVIAPTAIVDDASWTTVSIDTKGYSHLSIYFILGATDIAMAALKVQTADADAGYADLAGADFSVLPATLPGAGDDGEIWAVHIDLRGKKRWFDLVATAGDGTAGSYATAFAILSRPAETPNTAAERGVTGQELFA